MKWQRCIVPALVAGLAAGCAAATSRRPDAADRSQPARTIRIRIPDRAATRIVTVPLEDYVRALILSELAPAPDDGAGLERMYEVQAVIARTYAIANAARHAREGFDLCSTTHCQLYQPDRLKTSRWARHADAAVRRTTGRVLWFGDEPARAVFHADCGGQTSAASTIWGGTERPYLRPIDDGGPAGRAHAAWSFTVDRHEIVGALNADARTAVGRTLAAIRVPERDTAGRAVRVELRGEKTVSVRGEVVRAVLTRAFGARTVRSTRFDVERRGEKFVFAGRGFGHGVGLCQAGARARIRSGEKPEKILARYYPGTRLVTLGPWIDLTSSNRPPD